jgi:hypothetical protein
VVLGFAQRLNSFAVSGGRGIDHQSFRFFEGFQPQAPSVRREYTASPFSIFIYPRTEAVIVMKSVSSPRHNRSTFFKKYATM